MTATPFLIIYACVAIALAPRFWREFRVEVPTYGVPSWFPYVAIVVVFPFIPLLVAAACLYAMMIWMSR